MSYYLMWFFIIYYHILLTNICQQHLQFNTILKSYLIVCTRVEKGKKVLIIFFFLRHISPRYTFQNMRISFFKFPEVSRANRLQECSLLVFHCKRHQSLSLPSLNAKISRLLYHLNKDFLRKEISPSHFSKCFPTYLGSW